MSSTTTPPQNQESEDKNAELPNCFISSAFEGTYGRFSVYKTRKDSKTYTNMSLALFNARTFNTKKGDPYVSTNITLSGAIKLRDELNKAIELINSERKRLEELLDKQSKE